MATTGNIYWRDIPGAIGQTKVVETKTGWQVGSKSVYWMGDEAVRAQRWLRAASRGFKGFGDAMSRMHFKEVARNLAAISDPVRREEETSRWVPMMRRQNARFNESMFRRAVEDGARKAHPHAHAAYASRRRRSRHGDDGPTIVTAAPAPAAAAPQASRYKRRRAGTCSICGGRGHSWQRCPHHHGSKMRNKRGRFTRGR